MNLIQKTIPMKDLFMSICSKNIAFVYVIDKKEDFFHTILRHEDKLSSQYMYFNYYSSQMPSFYGNAPETFLSCKTIGNVYIHPTAEVDPTAVVRILLFLTTI